MILYILIKDFNDVVEIDSEFFNEDNYKERKLNIIDMNIIKDVMETVLNAIDKKKEEPINSSESISIPVSQAKTIEYYSGNRIIY